MSVLIKGITKPTDCILCPMFRGAWQMCGLLNREVHPKGTPQNCPMVELQPHGRLIDADALVADLKGQVERLFNLDAVSESDFFIERNEKFRQAMWKNWCESFYEYLSARPTVIEAEEVQDGNALS